MERRKEHEKCMKLPDLIPLLLLCNNAEDSEIPRTRKYYILTLSFCSHKLCIRKHVNTKNWRLSIRLVGNIVYTSLLVNTSVYSLHSYI